MERGLQISLTGPDRTLSHAETPLAGSFVFADMSGIAGRRRTPCWTRLTATKTGSCYQRQQIRLAELFWGREVADLCGGVSRFCILSQFC